MEITKYLCEFFFGNFWHWAGLVIILSVVFKLGLVTFITDNSKKIFKQGKDKEEQQ